MAKASVKVRRLRAAEFSSREHNRYKIYDWPYTYLRKFRIYRICFRELARKDEIPGVKKVSW